MQDLTIEEHEAEIDAIEGQVKALRATQLQHHGSMEAKIRVKPIVGGPLDQTFIPNPSGFLDQLKALPEHLKQQAKDFFKGEN